MIASSVKVGDVIPLDCGYGGPDLQLVTVIGIQNCADLFDPSTDLIGFIVKDSCGSIFRTHGFNPNSQL